MKNTNETKLTIEALQKIMNGDLGGAREMMNNKKKIKTTLIMLGAEEDLENSSEKLN